MSQISYHLKKDIDHQIPLKDSAKPVNVRTYRYAYFHKAKIEKCPKCSIQDSFAQAQAPSLLQFY